MTHSLTLNLGYIWFHNRSKSNRYRPKMLAQKEEGQLSAMVEKTSAYNLQY